MTSNNQENQTSKRIRYLIVGMAFLGLLLGSLAIWSQRAGQVSPSNASPTLQINLPSVEYPTIPPSAPEFTVTMESIGNSGITGNVTFKDIGGTVAILLRVEGLPADEESEESLMPAELHYGTCAAPGALAYPMSAPDAGQSETDLSINLKEFNTQKPMAVLLYRSLEDHTPVACGDVQ